MLVTQSCTCTHTTLMVSAAHLASDADHLGALLCLQAELVLVQPAVAESISLKDLTIDFDDVYASILSSKVAQVQLFGQVHATGPADPNELHLTGTIKLERGEVHHESMYLC